MAERKAVALVVTSHDRLGDSEKPTGFWLEEAAVPYLALVDEGADVVVASPQGGNPPVDPRSIERAQQSATTEAGAWFNRWENDHGAQHALSASVVTGSLQAEAFNAVFVAGGHGAMWDLPHDRALTNFLAEMAMAGKLIGTVCHGAAVWVGVTDPEGVPVIRDRKITCYSDEEERGLGMSDVVPFMLETELRRKGAKVLTGPARTSFTVEDQHLVTGQNPASSAEIAALFVAALGDH